MNLIDTYEVQLNQNTSNFTHGFLNLFKNSFPDLKINQIAISSRKITFYCFLCKIIQKNLLSRISLFENSDFQISNTLIKNYLSKCQTLQQSLFILKQFLKLNDTNSLLSFTINPFSGQINICIKLNIFDNIYLREYKFIQSLFNYLNTMEMQLKKYFELIFLLLGKEMPPKKTNLLLQQKKEFCKFLKTYVISSQYYAWTILEGVTKSKNKQKNQYQEKKKNLRNLKKIVKESQFLGTVSKVNNRIQSTLQPVFILKMDEDQEIAEKNLVYSKSFNQQSKVLNQITLHQSQMSLVIQNQFVKLTTKQQGKIKVHIQKVLPSILKNQRKILQKLPKVEFCGLPRYYIIRNNPQKSANFRITNLIQTMTLKQYLEKSSQTLSLQTKLSLIHKVSNSMRYIKDNCILYHNLRPLNIKIKKGMIVKLTNFTNSFHENIAASRLIQYSDQRNTMFKNIFPYVSNVFDARSKTYDNQKSDSYSLGIFIYQILFQKLPFSIKLSTANILTEEQKFEKLCHKPLMNLQLQNCFYKCEKKLLLKFLMEAINHQIISNNMQRIQLNLRQRPYLDWFTIISKEFLNHQQNLLF